MALMIRKNRLREIRKSLKLSGYDLQLLSKIPTQIIYQIERGLKRPAAYEKVLLCEALSLGELEVFPDDLTHNREVEEA